MSKYTDDYEECIDLSVEPWKSLAPLCWNCVSPSRMGALAEERGITANPYTKKCTRAPFEEGRTHHRDYAAHQIKGMK